MVNAKEKIPFESPRVLTRIPLELESSILSSSVVEYVESIETTGHEVKNFDWSSADFNHVWE